MSNPLNDERHELTSAWHVIFTDDDGWELENMHDYATFPLQATGLQAAIKEGRKLSREIETRYHNP